MRASIASILGRTISGIVVAQRGAERQTELYLCFDDGSYYELWGSLQGSSCLRSGTIGEVIGVIPSADIEAVYHAGAAGAA